MKKIIRNLLPSVTFILFSFSQKANSQNLLVDGNFSTTTSITPYYTDPPPLNMWLSWANYYGTGASFTTSVQNGVCSYFIDNPGTNMYDVQLTQYGFPLILGHRYRLSFEVKADAERDFGVFIGEYGVFSGSWTNFNPSYIRHATPDWQTISFDFDAMAVFALHKLSFEMGIQKINMYFANISLIDLGPVPVNKVVIPGTFQYALGCSSDWDPNCDVTALIYNSTTGLWTGNFNVPAGCHQYKIAINGSWDINYGENGLLYGANISLYVPGETMLTFIYDPSDHTVQTTPIASGFSASCLPQVVLAGSFQTVLGCSNDWDANCTNTALSYVPATGLFENDFNIPAGYFEYRAILNNDWYGNNFGVNGTPNGNNYSINLSCATKVHFSYEPITHVVTATYNPDVQPQTVVIAGSFQSEVGCNSDWQPDCDNTRLHYDPVYQAWVSDTLLIPAGHWEYKITINNSWDVNYGQSGIPNGDNIPLDLCSPAKVVFNYYHSDCYGYHIASPQIFSIQPNTVVIAGSFQNELGCNSDWRPDCNKTRMKYDPVSGAWVDTLLIPAGHWEFKWAINNSMNENYGQNGERNGPAISLDLCYRAKVVFTFYYSNCNVYGYTNIITNGVCIDKFYDANLNRIHDPGEEPLRRVLFILTGNGITRAQITGSDGKAAFSNLPDGLYLIREILPFRYFSSLTDSQYVYLSGSNANLSFGNVCIGQAGAKDVEFWTSKRGEAALNRSGKMEHALSALRSWSLRNSDGTDFDPYKYDQLKTWMKRSHGTNMSYMLSVELAALFLNTELGYVDYYNSYIYALGCSFGDKFTNVDNLISYTNYYLQYGTTPDGRIPDKAFLECLKNVFVFANNDLNWVQPHPCGSWYYDARDSDKTEAKQIEEMDVIPSATKTRIWPNPSNNYFTLRPAWNKENKSVQLRVYNTTGQLLYETNGVSNKDYRFGDEFIPGIYVVQLIQNNNITTFKIVKQ